MCNQCNYKAIALFIYLQKVLEVRTFTGGTYFFCHEVFFRMYLPLALKVYDRLPIDSLGFMVAGRIKNHLSGLIHQIYSHWRSFLPSPFKFRQNEAAVSISDFVHPYKVQVFLIVIFDTSISIDIGK